MVESEKWRRKLIRPRQSQYTYYTNFRDSDELSAIDGAYQFKHQNRHYYVAAFDNAGKLYWFIRSNF